MVPAKTDFFSWVYPPGSREWAAMSKEDPFFCPHCEQKLSRWKCPPLTTWGETFHYVCFNDDCPYFVKGWDWMLEKYNVKSSYRHKYDPETGAVGPLPVWSKNALRQDITDEGS